MGWVPVPGNDQDAVHVNQSGEISTVTEKTEPVNADLVLIEDSEDSNSKKRVQLGNLPGGGGGGGGRSYATSPGDKPPDTPNALDDEFEGATFDTTKWTWRNQGGASAAVSNGRVLLTGTSQSGVQWRIVEQNAPSTPWTVTAKLVGQIFGANFASAGLVVVDSVSGRLIRWGPSWDVPWKSMVTRYTSVTAWSAHSFSSTFGFGHVSPAYLRIADDGTNLTFWWSGDGLTFTRVYSEGRTAFLTNAADKIGLGVHSEGSPPIPALSCDWFRVNWTPDWDPATDA